MGARQDAFTCVPSQPGLWGWEGKSRWKLGEGLPASSRWEGPADQSLPGFPDLGTLDWSPVPLPVLGLALLAFRRAQNYSATQ